MGLKTIVAEELKARKIYKWDKAPQAVPNKKASAKLERRRRGHQADISGNSKLATARTAPGSYNMKRG